MVVTIYGVCALTFMMVMYALESRGRIFVLLFALGCALSSIYGFLSGAWPFGVVELIWSGIALRRFSRESSTARGLRQDQICRDLNRPLTRPESEWLNGDLG